ncbi:hypothetical protein B0T19DRAFT_490755 [Cercophora scortea]|uniref:DUF7924 domain-containing protein n=1 Tax=Cercophora scortea TaxID=314031 RepID=A0AAE0IXB5_9PEZI|nr:hypothetical protein B0T19DRAFT_490755 [Cercophora scortea]
MGKSRWPQVLPDASIEPAIGSTIKTNIDPVAFWAGEGRWPKEEDWPEEASRSDSSLDRLPLARKKPPSTLSSMTPSDPEPREEKRAPYRDQRYETLLAIKGSFVGGAPSGPAVASQTLLRSLLKKTPPVPSDTLFRDDVFETTCQRIQSKNEARIIQDIGRLIVPSAESLATFGAAHLDILIESVDELWDNSIPFTSNCPQPQPDYSVGFTRDAFTKDQLDKLAPFIGDFTGGDYMTLAVRGIVELFRTCKREDELNRKILAFSVSHDDRSVQIYGHYPVIAGKDTNFTDLEGRDKWAAYRFTRNVYDMWMPEHFKEICSAIDQLPTELDFDVPQLSEAVSRPEERGSSQPESSVNAAAAAAEAEAEARRQAVTPDTSFTRAEKRRRGRELVD